jgi:hypothetical protein
MNAAAPPSAYPRTRPATPTKEIKLKWRNSFDSGKIDVADTCALSKPSVTPIPNGPLNTLESHKLPIETLASAKKASSETLASKKMVARPKPVAEAAKVALQAIHQVPEVFKSAAMISTATPGPETSSAPIAPTAPIPKRISPRREFQSALQPLPLYSYKDTNPSRKVAYTRQMKKSSESAERMLRDRCVLVYCECVNMMADSYSKGFRLLDSIWSGSPCMVVEPTTGFRWSKLPQKTTLSWFSWMALPVRHSYDPRQYADSIYRISLGSQSFSRRTHDSQSRCRHRRYGECALDVRCLDAIVDDAKKLFNDWQVTLRNYLDLSHLARYLDPFWDQCDASSNMVRDGAFGWDADLLEKDMFSSSPLSTAVPRTPTSPKDITIRPRGSTTSLNISVGDDASSTLSRGETLSSTSGSGSDATKSTPPSSPPVQSAYTSASGGEDRQSIYGHGLPIALVRLVARYQGKRLDKSCQLSNWAAPLNKKQIECESIFPFSFSVLRRFDFIRCC